MTPLLAAREALARARAEGTLPRLRPALAPGSFTSAALACEDQLLREGDVLLGALLEVPSHLEAPGSSDGVAFAMYSHHPHAARLPSFVDDMATWLRQALRSSISHPRLASVTERLRKGLPETRLRLPKGMTAGVRFWVASVPVLRNELPFRRLRSQMLPILAHEDVEHVLPLARALWPESLSRAWVDLGA